MKSKSLTFLLIVLFGFLGAAETPFDYDLHPFFISENNSRTMLCFHGYGGNYQIAKMLQNIYQPKINLVSFNFPDHDITKRKDFDFKSATFGTIDELLPALYMMNKIITDQNLESIDLYGFSAGGGAVINAIAVLNKTTYDSELEKIGIGTEEKKRLLSAIQQGTILLDTPLKSLEEIIAFRGSSEQLEIIAKNYRDHDLRPFDSLEKLKGLSLNVLLYFDQHDEVLSNRDDQLYIEKLQESLSKEQITVIIEDSGGHMTPHYSLWRAYSQKTE